MCTISFTCITDVVIPADIINEFDEWDLEVIRVWSGEVQVILDNNGRQLIFDNVRQVIRNVNGYVRKVILLVMSSRKTSTSYAR